MGLNKACDGKSYPPLTAIASLEAIQSYARAYNDDNPRFFDPSRQGGIVAPPLFAATMIWPTVLQATSDPELNADMRRILHRMHDMEFFAPIRPGDVITSVSRVRSIEKQPNGDLGTLEVESHNQSGAPVQRTLLGIFMRGRNREAAGGRPSVAPSEPPRGEPVVVAQQKIDSDQTFRYAKASGDLNPIHTDEQAARTLGLPGIIVHGLCTMAFTSKVMIDHLCSGDPERLKRLAVRFSRPVFPGQTIVTRVWAGGERGGRLVYGYETRNADGQAVIREGIAEVAA